MTSSVYGILSRSDRPTDGVSQSAEADAFSGAELCPQDEAGDQGGEALTGVRAETPDLVTMLHNLGGTYSLTRDGYTEIRLTPRAARLLRPFPTLCVYRTHEDVPDAFWQEVYRQWVIVKKPRPVKRRMCLSCDTEQATVRLAGRLVLCEDCAEAAPGAVERLTTPHYGVCTNCGLAVSAEADWRGQRDLGRPARLCNGCLPYRYDLDADGQPTSYRR